MSIVIIAVIALALGFLAAYVLPMFGCRPSPEQIKQQLRGLPGRLLAAFAAAWAWIKQKATGGRSKKRVLIEQFRSWVVDELTGKPDLRAWLLDLPEHDFRALSEDTIRHFTDLKIDLAWLAGGDIKVAPAVREEITAIACDYLDERFRLARHGWDIALFAVYYLLTREPPDSRQIELRRRVFRRVMAAGLAAPVPAYELVMTSEQQQQVLAARTLREAAAKDWDAFARVLAEALAGNDEPSP